MILMVLFQSKRLHHRARRLLRIGPPVRDHDAFLRKRRDVRASHAASRDQEDGLRPLVVEPHKIHGWRQDRAKTLHEGDPVVPRRASAAVLDP
jgi:hypothetical protein